MVINVRGVACHLFFKLSPILFRNPYPKNLSLFFFQFNSSMNFYGIIVKSWCYSSSKDFNPLKKMGLKVLNSNFKVKNSGEFFSNYYEVGN